MKRLLQKIKRQGRKAARIVKERIVGSSIILATAMLVVGPFGCGTPPLADFTADVFTLTLNVPGHASGVGEDTYNVIGESSEPVGDKHIVTFTNVQEDIYLMDVTADDDAYLDQLGIRVAILTEVSNKDIEFQLKVVPVDPVIPDPTLTNLKVVVSCEGVGRCEGVTVGTGTTPENYVEKVTDADGIVNHLVKVGEKAELLIQKAGYQTLQDRNLVGGEVAESHYVLPLISGAVGHLVPLETFTVPLGGQLDLSGAYLRSDASGAEVVIPNGEILLDVVDGSPITLLGLVHWASGGIGDAVVTWCWNRGNPDLTMASCPAADKSTYTVIVYQP